MLNLTNMKTLLRIYLASALAVTTTSIAACFVWYVQEYDMAYKLDRQGQYERAEIHRNNSLWLGMWGGLYGVSGVLSAGVLLLDSKGRPSKVSP